MLASSEMISENMKATRSVGLFFCKHESGKYCMVHIMRLYLNILLKKNYNSIAVHIVLNDSSNRESNGYYI